MRYYAGAVREAITVPFMDLSGRGALLTAVLGLGAVWVVANTSLAAMFAGPIGAIMANLRIAIGLGIVLLLAYWVLDETDEGDDAVDALEKTSDRAASASGGFLTVSRALIAGVGAVVVTSGDALVDLLAQAPTIVGQVGLVGVAVGAANGLLSVELVLAVGVLVIIVSSIWAERANA